MAEGRTYDCRLKPSRVHPDTNRTMASSYVRSHDADGKTTRIRPMPVATSDDSGAWSASRTDLSLPGTESPSASRATAIPYPQGLVLAPVSGYDAVGVPSPARLSRSNLPCIDTPASTRGINGRSGERPVGIPDLRQGFQARDQMWMAAYLLMRVVKKYGVDVNFHCKPMARSGLERLGMHSNFLHRTKCARRRQGFFEALMAAFDKYKKRAHRRVRTGTIICASRHEGKPRSLDKFN